METLPNEIVDLILTIAINIDRNVIPAIKLTSRQFHHLCARFKGRGTIDLMRYYLIHQSVLGVKFATSLRYRFVNYRHVRLLVESPNDIIEKIMDIIGNSTLNIQNYVEMCLRIDSHSGLMLAWSRGYVPDNHILTVALEYGRARMLLTLLQQMPNLISQLRGIEAVVVYSFARMSLFKMIEIGLNLKNMAPDPKFVSMAIYSIYKHSSMTQEPEFMIRWILDNLDYRPIYIPIRDSFTRINNMLKQHKFKFIQRDVPNPEHLFYLWG